MLHACPELCERDPATEWPALLRGSCAVGQTRGTALAERLLQSVYDAQCVAGLHVGLSAQPADDRASGSAAVHVQAERAGGLARPDGDVTACMRALVVASGVEDRRVTSAMQVASLPSPQNTHETPLRQRRDRVLF